MVRNFSSILLLALQASLTLGACPNIALPWGIYQSNDLDEGNICVYKNVRFGEKPVRFQKPESPATVTSPSLQPTRAPACYQVLPSKSASQGSIKVSEDEPAPITGPLPGDGVEDGMSEDCLFADLYVPASAFQAPGAQLPVVVWLYGGGYIFGSKDTGTTPLYNMPFYSGQGLLSQGQDFIFVAGNYRLGAFGWLAGPEVVQKGVANAGLWDQRLLVDFVSKYIGDFGGNADEISLWGESAGAGSILFHLTTSPPIPKVKKVLLQSPAYLWQWNPGKDGYAAAIYANLTSTCNCTSSSDAFECLQKLSAKKLQACNTYIVNTALSQTSLIPFNPAIDEIFVKDLPTVAFQKGDFPPLESLLVSHVFDESKSFTPNITTMEGFEKFLQDFMPGDQYLEQRAAINTQYPESNYPVPFDRAHAVIQDSSFTCNTRFIFDAYYSTTSTPPAYMMHYGFGEDLGIAVHASDLLPTYWNTDLSYSTFYNFTNETLYPGISETEAKLAYHELKSLSSTYQAYLATFATTGTPSAPGLLTPTWYPAQPDDEGDQLTNVMDVSYGLSSDFGNSFVDTQNSETVCSFWKNMSSWVEQAVGLKTTDHMLLRIQDYDGNTEL